MGNSAEVPPVKFLMTAPELMARRYDYRGQLRRHKNDKRNAAMVEFWKAHVAAKNQIGEKARITRASANEAASKEFKISVGQVRRVLKDSKNPEYLIPEGSLRRSIQEISYLARHNKNLGVLVQRFRRFEVHLAAQIEAGNSPDRARAFAVGYTAKDFKISKYRVRRIIRLYEAF